MVTGGVCRFGVLGPFVIERDGEAVPISSGRQRALLAVLLAAGGVPVSRDRLIDELWGERPPPSAVASLHTHLSKLRALLGGLLVLESAGYALTPGGYEVDAWRFDALVERARADPGAATELLREALGLFRGEPLCDVDGDGSVGRWRRELEEKRLGAIVLRVDVELARGAGRELVAELERACDEHPFEERFWGQLMLALYRAGRQADALEAYQRARRRFAGELGLEPGEPLARLQQQILERDPTLLLSTAPGTTAAVRARQRSSLPRAPTRLIGRNRELVVLAELLADPDVRLVTLIGPGGVGKTRLLLELARNHERDFRDGAVFVRLERLTDPALVAAQIAGALARHDRSEAPTADHLASYLQDRELLVALDNFEQLLDAAVLVAELLETAPGVRVLVSSRSALRVRGEQLFEVSPLELPAGQSDREIAESPAVQLFVQCARAANRSLEIDTTQSRTIATICRALDGLPLAIELAASRSHQLDPAQIADQLARPLTLGERALRDLPDRQQSLQATIRWSYDLLTPPAQAALRAAGVFIGGFTVPALEAVTGTPAGAQVDELLAANLIQREPGESRFGLLMLVRAFALEELEATGEAPAVRERHRNHFEALAKTVNDRYRGRGSSAALVAMVRPEHANVRAALEHAIETRDQASASELALGLRPLWHTDMLRHEAHDVIGRLFEHFTITGRGEIELLKSAAFVTGFGPSAIPWLERIVSRATELGDRDAYEWAITNRFMMARDERDQTEVERLRPAMLAVVAEGTDARSRGWVHRELALDAYSRGLVDEAVEHASRSIEIAQQIDNEILLGAAHYARLLAQSAREEAIPQRGLAELLELHSGITVKSDVVHLLWFVARYAAGVAPQTAGRWLALAELIRSEYDDFQSWPEGALRDETMAILGIDDLGLLTLATEPLDATAALAEAAAWVAERDPTERSPRQSSIAVPDPDQRRR